MSERDDELRARFAELRAETGGSGGVPDFQAMMARARAEAADRPPLGVVDGGARGGAPAGSRRRLFRLGAWASAALAATVAGVLLVERGADEGEAEFERLVMAYSNDLAGAWRSPTSGLLEVPGMEMLRSVPTFGGSALGGGAEAQDQRGGRPREENR